MEQGWLEIAFRDPSFSAIAFKEMEIALSKYPAPLEIIHVRWQKTTLVPPHWNTRYSLDVLFWYRKD